MKLTGTISIKQFLQMSDSEAKALDEKDLAFTEKELLDYIKGGPGSGRYPAGSGGNHTEGDGEHIGGEPKEGEAIHTPMGNQIHPEEPKPVIENHPDEDKKNNISIKRSTEKAHLITDGKKEMWIKKGWIRADGSLTKGAQEKWDAQPTISENKEAFEEAHTITDDDGHKEKFNEWKPSSDMGRLYFKDKSYIQASSQGGRELPSSMGGPQPTTTFVTAKGGTAEKMIPHITREHLRGIVPRTLGEKLGHTDEEGSNHKYLVNIGGLWSHV